MNKQTDFSAWHVLWTGALLLGVAGCSTLALTPTPTPVPTLPIVTPLSSPTPAPPFIHYASSKLPNVHLEFDYPGSWYFSEEKMPYTTITIVYLADPRILSVPTRPPDEPHGTPSDVGSIAIWIEPVEPGQTLETLVQEQKHINTGSSMFTLLADYPLEIDGHPAYALETLNSIWEVYTSVMFNRRIFFIAYDQVYTLDFVVAEGERGGEFEKGYDYFFKSLRIVP
jgi:hypothetical protein